MAAPRASRHPTGLEGPGFGTRLAQTQVMTDEPTDDRDSGSSRPPEAPPTGEHPTASGGRGASGDERTGGGDTGDPTPARPPRVRTTATRRIVSGSDGEDEIAQSEADAIDDHRARRSGDDAPPPRWRDRRERAVGWRSRDILRAVGIVFGFYVTAMLVWKTHQLFLIAFLGILFGLAVSSAVDRIHARGLRWLPRGVLAAVIVFGTLGVISGFFVWSGPTLATQFRELRLRLPEALDQVENWARQQGGVIAGVVLGSVDEIGTGASEDTLRVSQPVPEPVVVAPRTRDDDTSAVAIADSVAQSIIASRDSLAFEDTLGLFTPMVDSLVARLSENARAAALAAALAVDSVRRLQDDAATAEALAAARRDVAASSVSVVVPRRDTTAVGAPSLRDRALGSLSGATRYLFPFLTSTFVVLAGLVLVIFLAIYVAADPITYKHGMLQLFPMKVRSRALEVLSALSLVLRKWLVTQLIAMVVIGVVTTFVLYLLGVEGALPLGIIAGLFEFIPNIGPILSAVPAIAMGFVDSPEKALWVAGAYWAIQFLENQLLIPLLMQEGVDLPPVLTLLAQAILALVFGFLGLFVAVPLVAAALVTVRMLYVEDIVGEGLDPFDREDSPARLRRTPKHGTPITG